MSRASLFWFASVLSIPALACSKEPDEGIRRETPALSCTPPASATLEEEFPFTGQEQSQLCWAGVGEMVAMYFDRHKTQCEQVQERYPACNRCDLCPGSAELLPGPCNQGGWPNFRKMGLTAEKRSGPLSLEELRMEIGCHKRPVVFSWKFDGESGHMMLAYGYQHRDEDYVLVADPDPPCEGRQQAITYADYRSEDMPGRQHWDTFYGFAVR